MDCGTTLFTNTSGIINLPRNPSDYPATMNCTYTISISRLSDIWIETHRNSEMPFGKSQAEFLKSFQDCDRENLTVG